jgi:hypothetical protein
MKQDIGETPQNLTPEIMNDLYERETDYLKTRVGFVFSNNNFHHNNWVVATWAKYLRRSIILKKGTDND